MKNLPSTVWTITACKLTVVASFFARDPGKNQFFPPHSQLVFLQCIDSQCFIKIALRLGTSESTLYFCKLLIINYFKRGRLAVGWKMTRQIPIFTPHSACISLAFHLHSLPSLFPSFFRQRCSFSGHRKRNRGVQRWCQTGNAPT